MAGQHGSRTMYNTGCRCDDCRMAERDYDKRRRLAKVADMKTSQVVTSMRTDSDDGVGSVEAGVMAEIAGLSTAESHPGLVAVARRNAQILDSPLSVAQVPSASKVLLEAMDKLRKGADGRTGRLASVRQMTSKATG
jgi:hypothetical protein